MNITKLAKSVTTKLAETGIMGKSSKTATFLEDKVFKDSIKEAMMKKVNSGDTLSLSSLIKLAEKE